MNLPILFHKGKSGVLFQWRVWTDGAAICTSYGQVDGAQQTSRKMAESKNVGKKNVTSAEAQAELEAQSMWTAKRDRKYSDSPEGAQDPLLLPMLAHPYEKRKGKGIVFPCDIQRKFNGVRCLAAWAGDKVVLYSRNGKTYNIPHISEWLEMHLPEDTILDGEIYIHGESLQRINGLVKKHRHESWALEYHVYDVPRYLGVEDEPWKVRRTRLGWKALCGYFAPDGPVKMVETLPCKHDDDVHFYQRMFVEQGYEGAIVRMLDGLYLFGYRSYELLKVKTFQDGEFEVVGATNGVGKHEKAVIWKCRTEQGKTFHVVPKGTQEQRESWLRRWPEYVGKKLTVRYFDFTPDGIPFHPVGEAFRLDQDL